MKKFNFLKVSQVLLRVNSFSGFRRFVFRNFNEMFVTLSVAQLIVPFAAYIAHVFVLFHLIVRLNADKTIQ